MTAQSCTLESTWVETSELWGCTYRLRESVRQRSKSSNEAISEAISPE